MPKPLHDWLLVQAQQWQIPGLAVQFDIDGSWHKHQGELPGWTDCGRWIASGHFLRAITGRGQPHPSPFATEGGRLFCITCFHKEMPLIEELDLGRSVGRLRRRAI